MKLIEGPSPDPVVTYSRVDFGREAGDGSRLGDRQEPRFDGSYAGEDRRAPPAFDAGFDDDGHAVDRRGRSGRRPWALRLSVVGGAIAVTVGFGLLIVSFATATIGSRPTLSEAGTESFEPIEVSGAADGSSGVLRNVAPFGGDTETVASAETTALDIASPGSGVAEAAPLVPLPAPRVRPDPATVAAQPTAGPGPAALASADAAAPTAAPQAGTDGLIANIERILDDGRPVAAAVPPAGVSGAPAMDALPPGDMADAPAMEALPPGDFEDAPAMDAWPEDGLDPAATAALPQAAARQPGPVDLAPPGIASAGEVYGPPAPYPGADRYGAPPRLLPGQLYIPPEFGAPVPPADIPGVAPSTRVF